MHSHDVYMRIALDEAWKGYEAGEVPVGAVLLASDGTILGRAYNQTISRNDPTAHAEILALRQAAEVLGNYRLLNTTLYVTVEPCIMCAGALIHGRVEEVVYGAPDPKWGGLTSLYELGCDSRLNHRLAVVPGVLEYDCGELIKQFFREKRQTPADAPLLIDPFSI
jgi:tRNA(adenine34) deaminase